MNVTIIVEPSVVSTSPSAQHSVTIRNQYDDVDVHAAFELCMYALKAYGFCEDNLISAAEAYAASHTYKPVKE